LYPWCCKFPITIITSVSINKVVPISVYYFLRTNNE
jgi:hypothetical protein